MPKLKITLTQKWNKRTKEIEVLNNGKELGTVYNGETSEFDIPDGSHKISVKSGWYGSKEVTFSIHENETKSFSVDVFKYGNLIISSLFAVIIIHFIASTFFNISYLVWLNIPALLIMAYYLTLGRNDYLVIKEN
ncbi:hypothetical protein [Dyadobacter sp. LHD-138]|uniref:hypothetical protein n=1 Tax=Dyadobacter sp. LHD-138 TaxID=3071413 RepID=UPI0027DFB00D|nr:hypothetical protein [Dyadobacter sp. LHD-138]MDQ6480312.1 hypothetical protein [Dyadobacter sp. LHD-138]